MIKDITKKLYSYTPQETVYHYTTFAGLLGIVQSGVLWTSDIRYMNDSAEMKYTVDLIGAEIAQRITAGHKNPHLLNQFLDWVSPRMAYGHMLFCASFRSNGNLLSQWRGYSPLGKGVSIGFNPDYLVSCATSQSFSIGKCVYEPADQRKLIKQVIDEVENLAHDQYSKASESKEQRENSCYDVFTKIESDLLRIAAILKHPSFQEEEEWRIVSPVLTDYVSSPVLFREGATMLVPYLEFNLALKKKKPIPLDHIFLGPTPNKNLSMNSLTMFLSKNGIAPKNGISYCQIPYRAR
ncbi:MAG: DUF2971 domain-containing protein [Nitrospirota bacterium]